MGTVVQCHIPSLTDKHFELCTQAQGHNQISQLHSFDPSGWCSDQGSRFPEKIQDARLRDKHIGAFGPSLSSECQGCCVCDADWWKSYISVCLFASCRNIFRTHTHIRQAAFQGFEYDIVPSYDKGSWNLNRTYILLRSMKAYQAICCLVTRNPK